MFAGSIANLMTLYPLVLEVWPVFSGCIGIDLPLYLSEI